MRDDLTKTDATALLGKLTRAYGKPFGTKADELAELWHDKLRWYPATVVKSTAERWIETETRFPTIAGLLARIKGNLPKTDAERNPADYDGKCPSCHTEPRVAGYERPDGSLLGRMRCDCTPPGQGWYTPAARAWREREAPTMASLAALLGKVSHHMTVPAPVEYERGDAYEDA